MADCEGSPLTEASLDWLGWLSALAGGQGRGNPRVVWSNGWAPVPYKHGSVPLLTSRFTGLLLKATSTKRDVSIPNRWKEGITDSFSLAWVMDVAAKKQMNPSSYRWSPVTTEWSTTQGTWECGLFCKFTEASLFLFLEIIHPPIHTPTKLPM